MKRKILLTSIVFLGMGVAELLTSLTSFVEGHVVTAAPKLRKKYLYTEEVLYSDVRGTVYHAIEEQTDDTPLITADGSLIDTTRVNELRWIAISRDMVKLKTSRYNFKGKITLGDTVWISYDKILVMKMAEQQSRVSVEEFISKYEKIAGWWIVRDTMGDYHWGYEGSDSTAIAHAKSAPTEYKIENGRVYRKNYQRNWIDFLQHPKTGMLEYWNKSLIITKKRRVPENNLAANGV